MMTRIPLRSPLAAAVLTVVAAMNLCGCTRTSPRSVPAQPAAETPAQSLPRVPALPATSFAVGASTNMPPDYCGPSTNVEVFGNFHTAGVIAGLPADLPAKRAGKVRCFLNVDGAWAPMQDLVPVRDYGWYAASLFWLVPGCRYQVKVQVLDRAGSVWTNWYGEGQTRVEPVLPKTAHDLYVATVGRDDQPGTRELPLRTVGEAMSRATPGTTIWLRGGIYYEGDLEFVNGRKAKEPLVLRSFPGERAVLDGSDPALADAAGWESTGDGLYRHACGTFASCVVAENLQTGARVRLMPVHTLDELRRREVRKWTDEMPDSVSFQSLGLEGGVYQDGTNITLSLPGPIADYRVHVSRRQLAIRLDTRSHVSIDGLDFRYYGAVAFSGGIYLYNGSDVLVQNCLFAYCDFGISIKGMCDRVTVQDNRFMDAITTWPFGMLKMGGSPCKYETGAVNVTATYSGRGMVVRRNRIEGYFDGAHLTPWTTDDARSNETDFYQNIVDGCLDDFVEVDGYARNVRIFDNYLTRSLSGVSLAQALDGPTYIAYNVLANCGAARSATVEGNVGRPFKTNGGPEPEVGSGPIFFYHNTAWAADTNSVAMLFAYAKWSRITFRNNIWCASRGVESWQATLSPMDFDYDNLYAMDTNSPLFRMDYHTRYDTLDLVRRKLRHLAHGISADPQLAARGLGAFRLSAGSPCVDAGVGVPGINDGRARGAAPDLGAYECR